jgi:predicted RNase H-like HicB family nuclease
MKYLVIYEKSSSGWGAYVPDLPGLGVAGTTLDEVKQLIREAMDFHLEGMREHGDPIPEPSVVTEYVSVKLILYFGAGEGACGPRSIEIIRG